MPLFIALNLSRRQLFECVPRILSDSQSRVEMGISLGASSKSKVSGLPCEPRDIHMGHWIWTYPAI